jgi:hypothetical protein
MSYKQAANKGGGGVELLRLQVAAAESRVTNLREQSRLARRRRKEAKRMAQKARKALKEAKCELASLREALEKMESKGAAAPRRAPARKKPAGVAKTPRKKPTLATRSPSPPKKTVVAPDVVKRAPKRKRPVRKAAASPPPIEVSVPSPVSTPDLPTPINPPPPIV